MVENQSGSPVPIRIRRVHDALEGTARGYALLQTCNVRTQPPSVGRSKVSVRTETDCKRIQSIARALGVAESVSSAGMQGKDM